MLCLQIYKADFACPPWFSSSAKKLIHRILDPNPSTVRLSIIHFDFISFVQLYDFGVLLTCFNDRFSDDCLVLDGLKQRITIAEVIENEWFKKGYKPPIFEEPDISVDDIDAIFDESMVII